MSAPVLRVAVVGAAGRMGARLDALAAQRDDTTIALACDGAVDRAEIALDPAIDAVIDFSTPDGTVDAAALATSTGAALLVCTTGLHDQAKAAMKTASDTVPTMHAPNTSLGVAVLRRLAADAVRLLGPEYTVEIVEAHHGGKRDAPSGTALSLAEAIRETGRALPPERIHAIRGGDVIGEHEIWLAGPGETIRLSHSAVNRDLFAHGALRAARWLAGRAPGVYRLEDSLAG